MDKSNKGLWVGLLVVLIIAIGAFVSANRSIVVQLPSGESKTFGAVSGETNLNTLGVSGLKVGPTCNDSFGSSACDSQSAQFGGTCAIIGGDVSQAATTTKSYDCAVTGVVSGDAVLAQFASTTVQGGSGTGMNWVITGAKASSTSGYLTFTIANLGDTARVLSATNIGSTTNYWVTR